MAAQWGCQGYKDSLTYLNGAVKECSGETFDGAVTNGIDRRRKLEGIANHDHLLASSSTDRDQ